jgi:hypothetical protein
LQSTLQASLLQLKLNSDHTNIMQSFVNNTPGF